MIRLSKSAVGEAEKKALADAIDEGYLGMGSFVRDFEKGIAGYLGRRNVLCLNSGTAALHLAVMGAGVVPGDEVLVQSLTFVGSFQAITAAGATAIPCEVLNNTCTIDLDDAEKKITEHTKAIMPVHYASRAGDLEGIYKFAEKHKLRVIEDAAHSFGCLHGGRKIGSHGDIVCFSFDGIKNITSGEGGAVVTDDPEALRFIMDARLVGIERDTEKRYQGKRSWEFNVTHQGYRYHMSNLFAAVGMVQLERFEDEFKPARQRLAKRYHRALKDVLCLELFPDDYDTIVPHIFPVKVLNGERDGLRQHLIDGGIECGVHYYPNHLLDYFTGGEGDLPVTEGLYKQLVTIPLHPGLETKDQDIVIERIRSFFERGTE